MNENHSILIQNFTELCTTDQSVLIQVVAWYPSGDKPLPKPMLTKMIDAMWRH